VNQFFQKCAKPVTIKACYMRIRLQSPYSWTCGCIGSTARLYINGTYRTLAMSFETTSNCRRTSPRQAAASFGGRQPLQLRLVLSGCGWCRMRWKHSTLVAYPGVKRCGLDARVSPSWGQPEVVRHVVGEHGCMLVTPVHSYAALVPEARELVMICARWLSKASFGHCFRNVVP
jgi:hypothetical protein